VKPLPTLKNVISTIFWLLALVVCWPLMIAFVKAQNNSVVQIIGIGSLTIVTFPTFIMVVRDWRK